MDSAIALFLLLLVGSLALSLLLRFRLRRLRDRLRRRIGARFPDTEMLKLDLYANFFGVRSRGFNQIRGMGGLVLTPQYLYFLRAAPQKEFAIPLDAIHRIDYPRQFLGKSILYPLLRVTYTLDGEEEEIAWAVRQPQEWGKVIARAIAPTRA